MNYKYTKIKPFFLGQLASIFIVLLGCNLAVDENRRITVSMDESGKTEGAEDELNRSASKKRSSDDLTKTASLPSKKDSIIAQNPEGPNQIAENNTEDAPSLAPNTIWGVRKLTSIEYAGAMQSLVEYEVDLNSIPKDNRFLGVLEIAAKNPMSKFSTNDYFTVAKSAASQKKQAISDAIKSRCDQNNLACIKSYIVSMLEKAYGKAPSSSETANYIEIFKDATVRFEERVEGFLTSLFISPNFVFQIEDTSSNGKTLTPGAIGKRMSLLIWNSLPNEMVLEKVRDKSILNSSTRAALAREMLKDPRAMDTFVDMIRNWFELSENALVAKSDRVIDSFSDEDLGALKASFITEARKSFDAEDMFHTLFSNSEFDANSGIARVFSESSPRLDENGQSDQLSRRPHSSMLMHPFVMASHSFQSGYFNYKYSVFLLGSVLCKSVPHPPKNIDALIEKEQERLGRSEKQLTYRQSQERLTSGPSCVGCHTVIGPPGFAFLPFDPIARHFKKDSNSIPYDTTGTIQLDGVEAKFNDAIELSDLISKSNQVRTCFNKIISRSYLGRSEPKNYLKDLGVLKGPVSYESMIEKHVSSALFLQP